MHRVKGLEFNFIFASGVNNKVLPIGIRSDFSADVSLEEFETEEKCLLFVALTRDSIGADVTCYGTMSEFIVLKLNNYRPGTYRMDNLYGRSL